MFKYLVAAAAALYSVLLIFGDESRRPEITRQATDDVTGFTLAEFAQPDAAVTVTRLQSDITDAEAVELAQRAGDLARANRKAKPLRGVFVAAATPAAASDTTSTAPDQLADMWYVTGSRVNLRAGPGTGNAVVGQLALGDAAEVLDDQNGWYQIRTANGAISGWIFSGFLTETKPG